MTSPELESILQRARDQVARHQEAPATEPANGEVEGRGTAADDRVEVVVRGGKIDAIEIQPLAMRLSNADLAEAIKDAANAAIAEHTRAMMASLQDQQTDFGSLRGQLAEIQQEATRAMQMYAHGMNDALRRAAERG